MTRATGYSKAATHGQWSDVWDSFDRCQNANASKAAANEDAGGERDMFGHAGVAAE